MERQALDHPFDPFCDENSEVLILGTFPSPKSREMEFFYGHPQNRFWKVLAAVYGDVIPETVTERKDFLRRHHVALWDVIAFCTIEGASDSSIRDVVPNSLRQVLDAAPIRAIYLNGKKADKLYRKFIDPKPDIPAHCLPSTSPANAAWTLDRLTGAWERIVRPDPL